MVTTLHLSFLFSTWSSTAMAPSMVATRALTDWLKATSVTQRKPTNASASWTEYRGRPSAARRPSGAASRRGHLPHRRPRPRREEVCDARVGVPRAVAQLGLEPRERHGHAAAVDALMESTRSRPPSRSARARVLGPEGHHLLRNLLSSRKKSWWLSLPILNGCRRVASSA